jgi:hypothetical protein
MTFKTLQCFNLKAFTQKMRESDWKQKRMQSCPIWTTVDGIATCYMSTLRPTADAHI